jgi:hypothetical protein
MRLPELGDEMAADVIAAFKRISSSSQADKGVIMTVEQLLRMAPDAAMAWVQENRATFELVPLTPSDEMIKAAAGPDYSQEDRELVTREWVDMIETHRHGYSNRGLSQRESYEIGTHHSPRLHAERRS